MKVQALSSISNITNDSPEHVVVELLNSPVRGNSSARYYQKFLMVLKAHIIWMSAQEAILVLISKKHKLMSLQFFVAYFRQKFVISPSKTPSL